MPFQPILRRVVALHPELVRAVVFCDYEGERVDGYTADPSLDQFDVDILGASFASVLPQLTGVSAQARMRVVQPEQVVWIQQLIDGYYLVVMTRRVHAADLQVVPALQAAAKALIEQM